MESKEDKIIEELNKKLKHHWETTKEERKKTHTGKMYEKKRIA